MGHVVARHRSTRPTLCMSQNAKRLEQLRKLGVLGTGGAAIIGTVAMIGWLTGIDVLKSVVPGLVTMKANTALTFIVLGAGLYLLRLGKRGPRHGVGIGMGAALFALGLSALIFSQYVHGHDLGIDEFVFHEAAGAVGTVYPGRMALNTSVCFILAALGAVSLPSRIGPALSPAIGVLIAGAGLLAIVGYATGVSNLYGISEATQMAVPTATGFVLLGTGLITGHPGVGPTRMLTSEGPGGALVRMLPLGICAILLLAVLRLTGQEAGLYGTQVGTWLLVSGVIAILIPAVWRVAATLEQTAAERTSLAIDNEAILNSAGNGIFRLDVNGVVTFANPAATQMLGGTETELAGKQLDEVTHHGRGDGTANHEAESQIQAALLGGEIHHASDEIFWRRDGTCFDVEYTSAPIRQDGRVVGATVVFSDISGRRQTERDLADKQVALERTNAALEQFTAVAAHDLNSPMFTVAGFAGLLERDYGERLGQKGLGYLRRITSGVARSQALTDDLLALSRADHAAVERRDVDMNAAVDEVLLALSRLIEEKGATTRVGEMPFVTGDPSQIRQLLQNLISNAVKFCDSEHPVVDISAESKGGVWRFAVADNGVGIPPEKRSEIFGAFSRLHGAAVEGSGIGLTICRRIVERHGGDITVGSGIDGGSSFGFTLPGEIEARPRAAPLV